MNQQERILRYMTEVGPITSFDAVLELGIIELPKRISELRQAGHEIERAWVEKKNRFGENVRFRRYWLKERPRRDKYAKARRIEITARKREIEIRGQQVLQLREGATQ